MVIWFVCSSVVEDKIFYLMFCRESSETLMENFEGGRNAWRSLAEMAGEAKKYKSFDQEMAAGIAGGEFNEIVHRYGGEEF